MKLKYILFICYILLAMASPGYAADALTDIPLVWKPTSNLPKLETRTLSGIYLKKIRILPFTDKRENKNEIGRNFEHDINMAVTTKDDVAAWCTDKFKTILGQYGLNIVESKEEVILKGEILQFYVIEKSTYKSDVGFKIIAESPSGTILWQGITGGRATRFGRSYSEDNYYEALSNAYLEAIQGLLESREFIESLK
ncbi:MAG: hypothetical protein C4581_13030 [Nitrospiraceae bacterium]|nr:MAG: hypothetical protein C4581_13030 [Nitrospiraceae bacterium]